MAKLQKELQEFSKSKVAKKPQISAFLGAVIDGAKRVEVPNRSGYVYVRLRNNQSEVFQAFNDSVSPIYDLPVLVERQGNKYNIIGRDVERYQSWENEYGTVLPYLPRHGASHSHYAGDDVVFIYSRQFMPMLALPSGGYGAGQVMIAPSIYQTRNGDWALMGGTGTPSLLPYKPTNTNAVMVLIALNENSGEPHLIVGSGSYFSPLLSGTAQVIAHIPVCDDPALIPVAAVKLMSGTSNILWSNIYDVRQFFYVRPTGTSSGGGGGGG